MVKEINTLLDKTSMYRVVLYGLGALALWSIIGSLFDYVPFSIIELIVSFFAISFAAITTHYTFRSLFRAPSSLESTLITVFILFFLLEPTLEFHAVLGLALAGVVAIASKYIIAYRRSHIFNPAAIAAVMLGGSLIVPVIWWVGSSFMLLPTIIVGLCVVHKIHRFGLFFATVGASVATVLLWSLARNLPVLDMLSQHFLSWPIIFFASIMVTEPLSTPPRRTQRIMYGAAIGIISSIPWHVSFLYATPELTLIVANAASFFLGLRGKLRLTFLEKKEIARDTYEFIFESPRPIRFLAGQYLEWILPHTSPDSRGIKRYFTISSAPTESTVCMGVKIPPKASSFKQKLQAMSKGDAIYASQLSGDFTLPKNPKKPLIFIAGGIGITPFRSMIQDLIDRSERRDITLFFTANHEGDFAYQDVFTQAEKIGVRTVCVVTDQDSPSWQGERGFLNADMIRRHTSTSTLAKYYISGPPGMVHAYTTMLREMGVVRTRIRTDFFPGYL